MQPIKQMTGPFPPTFHVGAFTYLRKMEKLSSGLWVVYKGLLLRLGSVGPLEDRKKEGAGSVWLIKTLPVCGMFGN